MTEDQAPPLGVPGGPAVGDDSHAVLCSDMTELTGSVETGDHFGFFLSLFSYRHTTSTYFLGVIF